MKSSCLIVLICVVALSCNKPLPDYSGIPFNYIDTGFTDISVPANDNGYIRGSIRLLSGDAANQPISVVFKGAPPNVFLKYDSITCRANYDLGDSVGARNAVQGVYPMQAIVSNAATGVRTVNFNLTVAPPVNRVAKVMGYYYPSSTCGNYIYISCQIDSVAGAPGKIVLIDRVSTSYSSYGTFDTTYGDMDCCSDLFNIPSQHVHGTIVEGNGFLTSQGRINLNKTVITDTATYNCQITLSNN